MNDYIRDKIERFIDGDLDISVDIKYCTDVEDYVRKITKGVYYTRQVVSRRGPTFIHYSTRQKNPWWQMSKRDTKQMKKDLKAQNQYEIMVEIERLKSLLEGD